MRFLLKSPKVNIDCAEWFMLDGIRPKRHLATWGRGSSEVKKFWLAERLLADRPPPPSGLQRCQKICQLCKKSFRPKFALSSPFPCDCNGSYEGSLSDLLMKLGVQVRKKVYLNVSKCHHRFTLTGACICHPPTVLPNVPKLSRNLLGGGRH